MERERNIKSPKLQLPACLVESATREELTFQFERRILGMMSFGYRGDDVAEWGTEILEIRDGKCVLLNRSSLEQSRSTDIGSVLASALH